jgi:hypothetical protein
MALSYSEALQQGAKTYFTGKPCKYGHVAERYTKGATCVECVKEKARKRQQTQPEEYRKYQQRYYQENKSHVNAQMRKYRENNREQHREYMRRYREENRAAYRESRRRYQARKMQAIPAWADKDALYHVYANCPEGMHVDHIFPLQSDWVCGLHVPENLQYLTPEDNMSKGNNPWL